MNLFKRKKTANTTDPTPTVTTTDPTPTATNPTNKAPEGEYVLILLQQFFDDFQMDD